MLTTTTNAILQCKPCETGWLALTGQRTYQSKWHGTNDILEFADIIKTNGVMDAYWALRSVYRSGLLLEEFSKLYSDLVDYVCELFESGVLYYQDPHSRIDHYRAAYAKLNSEREREYTEWYKHIFWIVFLELDTNLGDNHKFDVHNHLAEMLIKFTNEVE